MPVIVDQWAAGLLQWLAPARCQYCGSATPDLPICKDCHAGLPWNDTACPRCALPQIHHSPCPACLARAPHFDSAWCAFRLESPIHQSIHGLKYHARLLQARLLGQLMVSALAERGSWPDLLIPVPLHHRRLFRRGYNQALEIARPIAESARITLWPDAVRRIRATADQIGTSASQRRRNVRGAFVADTRIAGRSVALLDDVMTTGATLNELARECRKAGATHIEAWAVARVA